MTRRGRAEADQRPTAKKGAMIGLRATAFDREAWERAAAADGRTLSAWIARRCNGEPTTPPVLPPAEGEP